MTTEPTIEHVMTCPVCQTVSGSVVTCPTCGDTNTPVVWVGATARYGHHERALPGLGRSVCVTVGAGIGEHVLRAARPRKRSS